MKILISGATGFIGKNLVEKLNHTNHSIVCIVRKKSKKKDLDFLIKKNVKIVFADIRYKNSINKIKNEIKSADIIIHLAGILGGNLNNREYYKTNVLGTKYLLDLCSNQKFIYCSTAGVYGYIKNGYEDSNVDPTNIYEVTKLEAEKLVEKYDNHVIVQPGLLYGMHDFQLLKLFVAIKKGYFFLLGNGLSRIHPTFIDDVTFCLNEIIKRNIRNQKYIIVGDKSLSIKSFHNIVSKYCGIKPNKLRIPLFIAKVYITAMEPICNFLKLNPILTKSRFNLLTKTRTFSNKKAKNELGFSPVKQKDGFQKTINWYKKYKLL